jgi:hypothetical protein
VLDPVTPPKYAWDAAATLGNHKHVVVPGVGHGTSMQGCVPDILEEFFDSADPAVLDSGCVSDLSRPPFFTNFAGAAQLHEVSDNKEKPKGEDR